MEEIVMLEVTRHDSRENACSDIIGKMILI